MHRPSIANICARLAAALCALSLSSYTASGPVLAHAAAATSLLSNHVAASSASKPTYTIIVLDMSGSMQTNDPAGVRCSAASAYINLSGPGDFVGVIGLDNNNGATDSEGFQTAQVWSQPVELSTNEARQGLIATINAKSHNCAPDKETPTYDSLKQALNMLQASAAKSTITGSVILLTDGAPDPDPIGQENAVNSRLRPQFQRSDWPINTIALGMETDFHTFLKNLAVPTSGQPYDDAHGPVNGVSPLNIAPFFVDIFTRTHPHFAQHNSSLVTLSGGETSRDLVVGAFDDHLYVIVTKDQAATQISLTTPGKQVLNQTSPGAIVNSDRNYAIFSIDGPQQGFWTVNATGSGQILVQDVVDSSLNVSIIQPTQNTHVLPLGRTFTLAATIDQHGQPISGATFAVGATITANSVGGSAAYSQSVELSDGSSPGTYQAPVNVPVAAGAGAYTITVNATQGSIVAISSSSVTVRLELFPVPFFLKGRQPVQNTNATVVQWDPVLGHLYAIPFPPVQWLGGFALDQHPANPSADVPGQVMLSGQIYPNATVTGTATLKGSTDTVPVQVVNDGAGHFHVIFPSGSSGQYIVNFETTGTFADSLGDLGPSTGTVLVTIEGASLAQELHAILYTLLYLLLLVLLFLIVRFFILPTPIAQYRVSDADFSDPRVLNRRRRLWRMLLARNVLWSRDTFNKPGLLLKIDRKHRVTVRQQRGGSGRLWSRTDSGTLSSTRFRRVGGVRYGRRGISESGDEWQTETETYTFVTPTRLTGPKRGRGRAGASRNRTPGRGGNRRESLWQRLFGGRGRRRHPVRRTSGRVDRGI